VVLPALSPRSSPRPTANPGRGAKLDFKVNVDPPPCTTDSFATLIRTPLTRRYGRSRLTCTARPPERPSAVRRAQLSCQEFPASGPDRCALPYPKGYVRSVRTRGAGRRSRMEPGHEWVEHLAANSTLHSAGQRPDPGHRSPGRFRPACSKGRPAPHQPFPQPPPPNTGGPTVGRRGFRLRLTRRRTRRYRSPSVPGRRRRRIARSAVPAAEKPWGPPPGPVRSQRTAYTPTTTAPEFFRPSGGTGIFAAAEYRPRRTGGPDA